MLHRISPPRASLPFVLAAVATLMFALPGMAASGHGGEEQGGLSFLALERYDLGIFTLIVFGLLCLILQRFAWPHIAAGLQQREVMLSAARDEALKAKADAEEMRLRLQSEFAQAAEKIRAMLEEARRDADELRSKEREAGVREAVTERDRALREIEAAKDTALKEIYQQSVQLAALMSSKALGRNMTSDDHARLVEESLQELNAGAQLN